MKSCPTKNGQLFCYAVDSKSLRFVIKQAVTVTLKLGIGNLIAKLFAHTFVFLSLTDTAGTVSALGFKSRFNRFNYLLVRI